MKRIIKYIILTVAAAVSLSCIEETVPVGGSVTQAQVSASKSAPRLAPLGRLSGML